MPSIKKPKTKRNNIIYWPMADANDFVCFHYYFRSTRRISRMSCFWHFMLFRKMKIKRTKKNIFSFIINVMRIKNLLWNHWWRKIEMGKAICAADSAWKERKTLSIGKLLIINCCCCFFYEKKKIMKKRCEQTVHCIDHISTWSQNRNSILKL